MKEKFQKNANARAAVINKLLISRFFEIIPFQKITNHN